MKLNGDKPPNSKKVGRAPKLECASSKLPEPFRHRWLSVGSIRQVGRVWPWSAVQLDDDEAMGPIHGMHGTLDAELEVQRTIRRAELTALLCVHRKALGPTMVHVVMRENNFLYSSGDEDRPQEPRSTNSQKNV